MITNLIMAKVGPLVLLSVLFRALVDGVLVIIGEGVLRSALKLVLLETP